MSDYMARQQIRHEQDDDEWFGTADEAAEASRLAAMREHPSSQGKCPACGRLTTTGDLCDACDWDGPNPMWRDRD